MLTKLKGFCLENARKLNNKNINFAMYEECSDSCLCHSFLQLLYSGEISQIEVNTPDEDEDSAV